MLLGRSCCSESHLLAWVVATRSGRVFLCVSMALLGNTCRKQHGREVTGHASSTQVGSMLSVSSDMRTSAYPGGHRRGRVCRFTWDEGVNVVPGGGGDAGSINGGGNGDDGRTGEGESGEGGLETGGGKEGGGGDGGLGDGGDGDGGLGDGGVGEGGGGVGTAGMEREGLVREAVGSAGAEVREAVRRVEAATAVAATEEAALAAVDSAAAASAAAEPEGVARAAVEGRAAEGVAKAVGLRGVHSATHRQPTNVSGTMMQAEDSYFTASVPSGTSGEDERTCIVDDLLDGRSGHPLRAAPFRRSIRYRGSLRNKTAVRPASWCARTQGQEHDHADRASTSEPVSEPKPETGAEAETEPKPGAKPRRECWLPVSLTSSMRICFDLRLAHVESEGSRGVSTLQQKIRHRGVTCIIERNSIRRSFIFDGPAQQTCAAVLQSCDMGRVGWQCPLRLRSQYVAAMCDRSAGHGVTATNIFKHAPKHIECNAIFYDNCTQMALCMLRVKPGCLQDFCRTLHNHRRGMRHCKRLCDAVHEPK